MIQRYLHRTHFTNQGRFLIGILLLFSLITGCGTNQTTQVTPPQGESAELCLPSLHELIEADARSTSLTSNTDPTLHGDAYTLSGGNVVMSAPSHAQLVAPADGMSYAIYRFSDLAVEDVMGSITINTTAVDGEDTLDYYLLYSDYTRNSWRTILRRTLPGERVVEFDPPVNSISAGGTTYIAVVTCNGASSEVVSIAAHFNFFGRYGIDHFECDLPTTDTAGADIPLNLTAVDSEGQTVTGFTQLATIKCLPDDMTVIRSPNFQAGVAEAEVRFGEAGFHTVFLEGMGGQTNGTLGVINVYQTGLPIYAIEVSEADLASLAEDPQLNDYYPADATLDGQSFDGVRVRYRGGVSRDLPKKSWKIKLNSDDKYNDPDWGYANKSINLNAEYSDPTLMREKLSYDVMNDMNLLTPHARFIHFRINGVFQGVYTQVEQPRTDWLENMGVNPDGPMYKAQSSNLEKLDSPIDYDGPFEKELNELEPFDDIAGLISAFNNWPDGEFHNQFIATFDAANYMNYMVANTLISQGDHLMKNYLLYHDRDGSGKWLIIPWDHDLTWGHHWDEELGVLDLELNPWIPIDFGSFTSSWSGGHWGNHLMDRWLGNPQFLAAYKLQIADKLDNYFTEEEFISRIDEAYDLILPDALLDPQKYTDGVEYDVWVEYLREYVRQRRVVIAGELE